jgi:hypothetical protein
MPACGLEEGCYGAPFFSLIINKILKYIINYFQISLPSKTQGIIDQVTALFFSLKFGLC